MHYIASSLIAVGALSSTVYAASCSAVGYLTTNVSPGPGGFSTGSQGISIIKDGAQIGSYDPCDTCDSICKGTDQSFIGISSGLPYIVEWGADCGVTTFDKCVINYADQVGIQGSAGNDDNFYGLGISTSATCEVKFNC